MLKYEILNNKYNIIKEYIMVSNNLEDVKLYSTFHLEDLEEEKIAFVIDMFEEIKNDDYLSISGEEKLSRFEVLTSEIINYVKLKEYISTNTLFGLYLYDTNLKKKISFCKAKEFINEFDTFKNNVSQDNLVSGNDTAFDLAQIYSEALEYIKESLSIDSFGNAEKFGNEIVRFILFYNRSYIPAICSNTLEYNMLNFVRMPNFIFDVVFMRKKIINEDDKKLLGKTFASFTNNKPKTWYAFENSGSVQKLKYYLNLLLANPSQRVLLVNVEKYKKKIDELITNFSPDM